MPEIYKRGLEKIRKLLPDWKIVLHDEASCTKVVKKYPEVWEIYRNAPKPIHKVDIARLCLVNEFGGFYMDLGIWLKKSLNRVRDTGHDLVLFLDSEGRKEQGISLHNGAFGSSPNSAYLHLCLDIINERFRSNLKKFTNDPIWGTGPDVVSSALHYIDPSYTVKGGSSAYDGPSIRKKVFDKRDEVNEIFVHRGLGSWKENNNLIEKFYQNTVRNKPCILLMILLGVCLVVTVMVIVLALKIRILTKYWAFFLLACILSIVLGITIFSIVRNKTSQNREIFTNKELLLCPRLLENTVKFIESLYIPYWLTAGTLLGTIREGNIIKNDTDLDIAIPKKYSTALRAAIKKGNHKKFGLECSRDYGKLVSFVLKNKKGVYIDVYDYIETDGLELTQARLMNRLYYIPKNSEKLLECMYGNWKVPSDKHATLEDMENCTKKLE